MFITNGFGKHIALTVHKTHLDIFAKVCMVNTVGPVFLVCRHYKLFTGKGVVRQNALGRCRETWVVSR